MTNPGNGHQDETVGRDVIAALLGESGTPRTLSPAADVFDRALRSARTELARGAEGTAPIRGLPRFFRRELLRVAAAVAVPTAALVMLHLFVLRSLPGLLDGLVPEGVIWAGVAVYAATSLGWLALAVATLPFAAHHRAVMRGRRDP